MKQTNIPRITKRPLTMVASVGLLLSVLTSNLAQGQNCELYPIALSVQTLTNVQPGTIIPDIFNGVQPGNFGWLSWAGSPDEPTLAVSLKVPGNCGTYVNPDSLNDHVINVGDWVSGKPGVSNSHDVRDALDALEDYEIVVPVWDKARGQGSGAAYRVCAFARVRILGYRLPSQNRISVVFLGYENCDAAPPA